MLLKKMILVLALAATLVSAPALAVVVNPYNVGTYFRNSYSSTNVTTGAYVQIIASLGISATAVYIFDSSGQTLVLGVGGSGSEVVYTIVEPGGNGWLPIQIQKGSRISLKALSGTASSGTFDITFFTSP